MATLRASSRLDPSGGYRAEILRQRTARVGWMGSVHAVGRGDSLIGKQATEAWQWLENGGDRVRETGAPQLWQN